MSRVGLRNPGALFRGIGRGVQRLVRTRSGTVRRRSRRPRDVWPGRWAAFGGDRSEMGAVRSAVAGRRPVRDVSRETTAPISGRERSTAFHVKLSAVAQRARPPARVRLGLDPPYPLRDARRCRRRCPWVQRGAPAFWMFHVERHRDRSVGRFLHQVQVASIPAQAWDGNRHQTDAMGRCTGVCAAQRPANSGVLTRGCRYFESCSVRSTTRVMRFFLWTTVDNSASALAGVQPRRMYDSRKIPVVACVIHRAAMASRCSGGRN